MSTPDVRPRLSSSLAQLLRPGAALPGCATIGGYLETVVRPMVMADIARRLTIDPTLALNIQAVDESVPVPVAEVGGET